MRIPKEITNDSLESLYDNLDDDILNISMSFKSQRFGLLARLCQFFITYLKYNPNTSIKFFQLESSDKSAIEKMLQDPQSLTALLMAENVFSKDVKKNNTVERVELKSKINHLIQNRLNKSVNKEGHRLQLFAVDHSISKYAYPSCFYQPAGTEELKQSGYYTELIRRFLESSVKQTTLNDREIGSLGDLIFELIENTEQHGKSDYEDGKSSRSVRGLIIDYKMVSRNKKSQSIGGEDHIISEYLESFKVDDKPLHLLELSIFDSGAGIAKNLASSQNFNISNINDEVDIVSKSFAKGITSKANKQGYGRGLNNVKNVLNERRGFFSIRTGRISVYRNFNMNPLYDFEQELLQLFDETNKSDNNFKELKTVEGLACSILVPLL